MKCGLHGRATLLLVLLAVGLAGCGSQPTQPTAQAAPTVVAPVKDGTPPLRADLMSIPDAVPRPEPVTIAGNKSPYTVLGSTYRVRPVPAGHRERGYGSWYGTKFHGKNTSKGEPYDVYAMTAAHKTLPIPSYVRVTNLENGNKVIVRVNDRGPFHGGRVIDLSYAAAYRLGYAGKGTALVELEVLDPNAPEWVARRNEVKRPTVVAVETPNVQRSNWLQAGAFRSMEGARQLQSTLTALLGREASIHTSDTESGTWYRVRVGPIDSMDTLYAAQRRIAAASLGAAQVVIE